MGLVVTTQSLTTRPTVYPRQVAAWITAEQGQALDEQANSRQLSISAILREVIRRYLDTLERVAA